MRKYEINLINKHKKMYFNESMHIFKYDEIIRQKLIEYKFQDKAYMYKTFAKIILKNKKVCGFLEKYDIIIPVPIHKKRRLKREGKKQEYEDMVDREQALELVLKAVDMQQKTVSKILSFHMDQNRELYYLEGRTRRKS